jgi:putative flavoprotein involved in K+ transport
MTTHVEDNRDVVVIGAGPAGLAVARQLEHQHGVDTLVVDRAAAPAISWRTRYDNFRLNTTGFLSPSRLSSTCVVIAMYSPRRF